MSAPFSCFNILKSQAKALSRSSSIQLSEAQQVIARGAGFEHFHEMSVVAKRNPMERRLMLAALGVSDLTEAIYENGVHDELYYLLESELSGAMADTNAGCFTIEDLAVENAKYDHQTGVAELSISLAWQGEQLPDRPFAGTAFYIHGQLLLVRREDEWSIADEDGLVIESGESDQDRDYEAEQDYLHQEFLKLKELGEI